MLPSHEPEIAVPLDQAAARVRPEEDLQPHADPRHSLPYAGKDERVSSGGTGWLVWFGAFFLTLILCTTAWGFLDLDRDGLVAWQELRDSTNPFRSDTDHDGLPDGWEVARGINPRSNDTDHDGLLDRAEIIGGFDPRLNDTNGNGIADAVDVPAPPPSCLDHPTAAEAATEDSRCDLRNPPLPALGSRTLLAFFGAGVAVSILVATVFTAWWRSTPKDDDE